MSMGAERAEAQAPHEGGMEWAQDWERADSDRSLSPVEPEPAESRGGGRRALAVFLVLLALGWLGAAGYTLYSAPPEPVPAVWLGWVATLSAPLVLLCLVWLLFGRSSRRETERFTHAVAEMRRESQALESVLAIVAGRIEENRARVGEESARLMALGDEASDRLGRVTHYLARETAELDRKSQALEAAAAAARIDIGVLLGDLPRAEEQARSAAEAMKQAGLAAHEQAASLEGQLAALAARGREADEAAGGAAQRLGAQVARIEGGAAAAAERMNEAAARMNAAVDGALERASDTVDRARSGIEAQGRAMLAMVEQGKAAFREAGADAGRQIADRLDEIGSRLETFARRLAGQDEASQAMVARLVEGMTALDGQLAALGLRGEEENARLAQSIEAVRNVAAKLQREVEDGETRSGALIDRAHEMAAALDAVAAQLRDSLPPALADVEERAQRTAEAASAAVPPVEAAQAAATLASEAMAETEASIGRQRESLDSLLAAVRGGAAEAEEKLRALAGALGETDGAAARLVQQTGPELIEALVRVREAANQAASHARDAIAAAIPDGAARLAEASREAVSAAVTEPVREQLAEVGAASQRAVAAAREAGERLTRQLLAIGETAAAIEGRLAEDRAQRQEKEAEAMARRVALLIEALNSTAIDVTKILSNEVTDTAWTAYLKGDRGVFTRRAVRLLDSGEAREIQRHYEEEPEFREQVNRYVHDFEAILRRVLADREGTPLGVTLLSSDMGKLYVALAQAIERLR